MNGSRGHAGLSEQELVALADRILERGRGMQGQLEVYAQQAQTTNVKVYRGEVESLVSAEPRGAGLRYVAEGRRGYAYTADLSDEGLDELVRAAAANAAAADPDPYNGLPTRQDSYPDVPQLWRPALSATSTEDKIAIALEAEAAGLEGEDIETVEQSVYTDGETQLAIVSSEGLRASSRHTFCYVYLSAHARRGSDVQTGLGFSLGREPGELDPARAGRDAARKAAALLGAAPCATGRYTIVLDREVAAAILGVIAQALGAEAVQKGRSFFAGRLGTRVGSALVDLRDDGLRPDGLGSSPFDDEGVACQVTPLVEDGLLRNFLHNTYTAKREGGETASTGNASRGTYRGTPGIGASNLILAPGEGDLEDLMRRVGKGLYVVEITGLHSGANPISGEFSVGASGHLIDNGALAHPVREVTIASDLLSMLENVADMAHDPAWVPFYGSAFAPSVAIEDVAVSGK